MVYRPNSDLSLFLYSSLLVAKNGFYILKGCNKQKQRICNRKCMWISVPKIFTVWPCYRESLLTALL